MARSQTAEGSDGPDESGQTPTDQRQVDPTLNPHDFSRPAWGWGLATAHASGTVLDTYYPDPAVGLPSHTSAPEELAMAAAGTHSGDPLRAVHTDLVRTVIDLDRPPANAPDAYLRLHLLSHRLVAPRTINLDQIVATLATVVWTSLGPCAPDGFEDVRTRLKADRKAVAVYGVDKFPRMVDYVIPTRVRIGDADRIRLGAHLAPGTEVLHEGFVNYDAGTLGAATIGGRISQGVVVGANSDIAGGASIMSTSSGGTQTVSVGERCLIGTNAVIGIAIGDDCTVEAGLDVTADTTIALPDGGTIKAAETSGQANLLFRHNSLTGAVEVADRAGSTVEPNASLHDR